jgi:hypothetical protein
MVIGDSMFLVNTEHGSIVYSVQPHRTIDQPGSTLRERAMMYGTQIAVSNQGKWYKPGMREEITDKRTIVLLERVPQA